MIYESIMAMMGRTPLLRYNCPEVPEAQIYVKLESFNPTGSIKDRACLYNINAAIADGYLTKDKIILDASSGNMACALAFYGKLLGYKVKVICGSKLTEDKRQYIKYFGADMEVFGDFTYVGNRHCFEISNTTQGKQTFCFLDQLHNPNNPQASFETLAPEIHTQLRDVKAIVGSMGSGGSMCGVTRYFAKNGKDVKIFTSQAASGTSIPGTGAFVDGDYQTPFIQEILASKQHTESLQITIQDAKIRTKELASQGVFVGFQGGGVLEATISAIKKHNIKGAVVAIIGDSGWKNMAELCR